MRKPKTCGQTMTNEGPWRWSDRETERTKVSDMYMRSWLRSDSSAVGTLANIMWITDASSILPLPKFLIHRILSCFRTLCVGAVHYMAITDRNSNQELSFTHADFEIPINTQLVFKLLDIWQIFSEDWCNVFRQPH